MTEDSDDLKSERSGRKSPSSNLEEAIGYLEVVQTRLGMGPFGLDALAEALGHKSGVSGSARGKVGSLTHFGVLAREGSIYRVSQVGKRVLMPVSQEDRRAAVAEAAAMPALYAELLATYAGQALPQLLSNVLVHNYKVNPNTATNVAETFRRSVEFAGLLRAGVLHRKLDPASVHGRQAGTTPDDDRQPPAPNDLSDRLPPPPPPPPPLADGLSDYRVPLTRQRSAVLRLPLPLDESDVTRLKGWLDLMLEVLTERPQPPGVPPTDLGSLFGSRPPT